jgi:predicted nucleic acid-binding protein
MRRVFLDTGYLIALEAADDQYHAAATEHWHSLRESRPRLITTSYVFDEVVTYFNSRGLHAKALEIGQRLIDSPSVRLIHVDEALFQAGWDYLRKRSDKLYSLTDCTSFVVMQRERLRVALAFDSHFKQAGFRRLPDSAG